MTARKTLDLSCFTVLLALLVAPLAAACSSLLTTRTADITADTRTYQGRTVTVSGRVTSAVNLLALRTFTLDDGSGEITPVTKRAVPREGEELRATGTVEQAFATAGVNLVVIVEQDPGR